MTFVSGRVKDEFVEGQTYHFSKYGVLEFEKTFSDVPNDHWAAPVIKQFAAKHIVEGTSQTLFSPEQPVTRAEFTALLVRLLGLNPEPSASFRDVSADKWYASPIATASQAGLVQGGEPDLFAPDRTITREQMAVLLVRAYELQTKRRATGNAISAFSDSKDMSAWAQEGVNAAYQFDLISGRSEGLMVPQGQANRAESVQAVYNLMNKLQLFP
ncbi:S-layer homology domain-containing protein [Paenibacillus validus]|uniref:S-layer homology domain-containing protein n=1 Tax=Paenibacillus TaxID=44249 RepID=UPI000FD9B110|nr:S-layer homology domain-containing protein [Paenibacillus validus]MED4599270.1 S-layer homology domain-containing protein [Paenibacillus validus]MED4605005.1 S-layer homology domain-containing protein [Paenibacillus validus]